MTLHGSSPDLALGEKRSYATVSLILGIASFVNLLGFEKPVLAILFGWAALRSGAGPALHDRRGWAKAGITLGAAFAISAATILVWKWSDILKILQAIKQVR